MGETVSINSLTSHSGRWRFCREGIPILRFSETVTLSLHFQKNFYKDFRSCILRASMKSPNSITAFLGPSFLTVSELFRFSSFQRKLAAPWLAAMFGTLDQPLRVVQAVSDVCALADQQPVRFRGYVLLARLRAHPSINIRSSDSATKWDGSIPVQNSTVLS